jgi:hypothetical protein
MLALRRISRQVVVADEELDGTDMVGKLLRKNWLQVLIFFLSYCNIDVNVIS